jgi:hypothetical protein
MSFLTKTQIKKFNNMDKLEQLSFLFRRTRLIREVSPTEEISTKRIIGFCNELMKSCEENSVKNLLMQYKNMILKLNKNQN